MKARYIVMIVLAALLVLCVGGAVVGGVVSTMDDTVTEAPDWQRPDDSGDSDGSDHDNLTNEQEQAVGAAESYLNSMSTGWARSELIGQLEFEGYSTADAEYAVDSLDVDWNEQAVLAAESYLDFQNFSRDGLADQLQFDGYTDEQIEHALNEVYEE